MRIPRQRPAVRASRRAGRVRASASRAVRALPTSFASWASLPPTEGRPRAAAKAAAFVRLCAAHTAPQDLPAREGIDFEPLLGALTPWKGERL